MIILIDFDGTCVSHEFPRIGKDIGAVPVLRDLVRQGHRLVLFTMRSDIKAPISVDKNIHCVGGKYLSEALGWFMMNGIELWGVQSNPEQGSWTTSPKAYGDLMIDDSALGCPLKFDRSVSSRRFVDWDRVVEMLGDDYGIKIEY
jgi:hypothetical protein